MDRSELLERYAAGERDFSGAYLRRTDLGGANLAGAILHCAIMRYAYLSATDLSGANLSRADLSRADLRGADLRDADLRGADLRGAYLIGADLHYADLHGADLVGADLRGANLAFSSWPLHCGSFDLGAADDRLTAQLVRHAREAARACDSEYGTAVDETLSALDKFHRKRDDVEPMEEKYNGRH